MVSVVGEDHGLFRQKKWAVAEMLTRESGVLGWDEVGMRASRPVRRELEHLRSERCEHPRVDRYGLFGAVQRVEVRRGRRERLAVAAGVGRVDQRCVADADPHQEPVALPGRTATFIDRPHHEALAATAIAGREDALDVRGVLAVFGLDVAAWIRFERQVLEQHLLGAEEAHGEQYELRRIRLLRAGDLDGYELTLVVLLPADLHGDDFAHIAFGVGVGSKLAARVVGEDFHTFLFLPYPRITRSRVRRELPHGGVLHFHHIAIHHGRGQAGTGAVSRAVAIDVSQIARETGRNAAGAIGGFHLAIDIIQ